MTYLSNIELLEKYFNYELNDAEDALFKNKLDSDAAFKEAYEIALVLRANTFEKRKAVYEQNTKNKSGKKTKTISLIKYVPLLSAAAILLFVGIVLFNNINSFDNEAHLAKLSNPKNAISIGVEKSETDYPILINNAIDYYKKKEFDVAAGEFMKQDRQTNLNFEYRYFLGLCLWYTKKYKQAATELSKINSPSSSFYKDALFYKALCYLELQELKKAKPIFDILKEDENFSNEENRKFINAMLKKL